MSELKERLNKLKKYAVASDYELDKLEMRIRDDIDPLKILWGWILQGHINLRQFRDLLSRIKDLL